MPALDSAKFPSMRQSAIGRFVVKFYRRLPARHRLLAIAVKAEGGQTTSISLRAVLRQHYGVSAGPHSYGSLLTPGFADRGTTIGPYASIGPNVRRIGAAHPMQAPSLHPYWYNPKLGLVAADNDVSRTPCEIGADTWIGANVTILPGCRRIGVGAVVGAGSVVTKDVDDFQIVVGNPARSIGSRLTADVQKELIAGKPWELPPAKYWAEISRLSARNGENAG
ncbi:CatB-related O-acetyltransferase [Herbiconiux aconitum]|uniref:CatB-related O-acetyltransferase n=1 Tax=Herbiconiux aconitum TaxID=2970913 RepID=UPI0024E0F898|nr:CatB-related O-acetyltransferase [Herbiconiux aconitum]